MGTVDECVLSIGLERHRANGGAFKPPLADHPAKASAVRSGFVLDMRSSEVFGPTRITLTMDDDRRLDDHVERDMTTGETAPIGNKPTRIERAGSSASINDPSATANIFVASFNHRPPGLLHFVGHRL